MSPASYSFANPILLVLLSQMKPSLQFTLNTDCGSIGGLSAARALTPVLRRPVEPVPQHWTYRARHLRHVSTVGISYRSMCKFEAPVKVGSPKSRSRRPIAACPP